MAIIYRRNVKKHVTTYFSLKLFTIQKKLSLVKASGTEKSAIPKVSVRI